MRIAIVHDWLTGLRGGERCLQEFLKIYPEADIYTLIHIKGSTAPEIDARVKKISFLQKIPLATKYYRALLPLFPLAISKFDFTGYDLIISLSHAAAKNITVPKEAKHICFCFSPMRYIWDQAASYLGNAKYLFWPLIQILRAWDKKGSEGVTQFVAISKFVAARIRCFYKRSSVVIYPPVDSSWIEPIDSYVQGDYFLYAGALVPYKNVDIIVSAFNELQLPLKIVGSGPEKEKLQKIAGKNIHFFGRVTDEKLAEHYAQARALVFPVREDFGMIPIECLAAGRPVLALNDGATKESINGIKYWEKPLNIEPSKSSGVFIKKGARKDAVKNLVEAVRYFLTVEKQIDMKECKKQAQKFSVQRFLDDWNKVVS